MLLTKPSAINRKLLSAMAVLIAMFIAACKQETIRESDRIQQQRYGVLAGFGITFDSFSNDLDKEGLIRSEVVRYQEIFPIPEIVDINPNFESFNKTIIELKEDSEGRIQFDQLKIEREKSFVRQSDFTVVRKKENLRFCDHIDRKLASVSFESCLYAEMNMASLRSARGRPIFYTDFPKSNSNTSIGKILVLGGIHGDELTSVSSVFLWMNELSHHSEEVFTWRIVPVLNPDGFFKEEPTRTNANGVDLNRNLPTNRWSDLALDYWKRFAKASNRKFPGNEPASEPESKWLIHQIDRFEPDVIVTVHAPYNLVDYDAQNRSDAPRRLGILKGKMLGTFPGSLGRYAGEQRNIPVITIELPHSLYLPKGDAVIGIFTDLVAWLQDNITNRKNGGLGHLATHDGMVSADGL